MLPQLNEVSAVVPVSSSPDMHQRYLHCADRTFAGHRVLQRAVGEQGYFSAEPARTDGCDVQYGQCVSLSAAYKRETLP